MFFRSFIALTAVVKAVAQGSSIGVTIAENDIELSAAIEIAKKYDNNILIEQYIKGRELTVAVMGSADITVLPIIEIVPHSGKYDYQSKYTKGATDYLVPAQLTQTVADKVSNIAENTFKALGCKGVARVDFMLDQAENPYVLEVNTIPGMTATSLVPKAAKSAGINIPTLCYLNLGGADYKNDCASCRICVVEVEGRRNLAPACATPVFEGMVVTTNSMKVMQKRKTVLELMLSDHPKDCLACSKNGECELQDLAMQFGVREIRFKGKEPEPYYPITLPQLNSSGNSLSVFGQFERNERETGSYGPPASL